MSFTLTENALVTGKGTIHKAKRSSWDGHLSGKVVFERGTLTYSSNYGCFVDITLTIRGSSPLYFKTCVNPKMTICDNNALEAPASKTESVVKGPSEKAAPAVAAIPESNQASGMKCDNGYRSFEVTASSVVTDKGQSIPIVSSSWDGHVAGTVNLGDYGEITYRSEYGCYRKVQIKLKDTKMTFETCNDSSSSVDCFNSREDDTPSGMKCVSGGYSNGSAVTTQLNITDNSVNVMFDATNIRSFVITDATWDGHLSGEVSTSRVSVHYDNNYGCYRNVSLFLMGSDKQSVREIRYKNCNGGSTPDALCKMNEDESEAMDDVEAEENEVEEF